MTKCNSVSHAPFDAGPVIGYLAPEIPALSETFVYKEFLGLERRGVSVVPISVHRPAELARDQEDLTQRVRYLYDAPPIWIAIRGFFGLLKKRPGTWKALNYLLSDFVEPRGPLEATRWKLIYQFLVGVKVADILIETHCRHLHVHFAHVPSQIAMYAAAMSAVPFTITAHANDIFQRGSLLQQKAKRAVRMITISEYNSSYLREAGVPANRLAVVRCGVSLPTYASSSFSPKHIYRIGTLGRLVEKKGIDVLIRALSILRNKSFAVELAIAGDGPLRHTLEHLVGDLDLQNQVTFEGSLPHGSVAGWMQSLDIFVLACRPDANGDMDGIPVVLMEAMSQSVPVVSTRLSGIPELVIDGTSGLLAEPGDAHDLAVQLARMLDSTALRTTLVAGALAHVKSEFGLDVNLDRLLSHFSCPMPAAGYRKKACTGGNDDA